VHPGKEKERRIGKIAHVANRKREIDSRLSLHGRARETIALIELRDCRPARKAIIDRIANRNSLPRACCGREKTEEGGEEFRCDTGNAKVKREYDTRGWDRARQCASELKKNREGVTGGE